MARVTVEDCLEHCKDRFYLVLSAAGRAHGLESGRAEPMVEEDNDKPTVVALREIAKGYDVDQDATEVAVREEEDRLAERFMAIKRGDAMADAMSLMPDESAAVPGADLSAEMHFSEHFKLATEAMSSLSDQPADADSEQKEPSDEGDAPADADETAPE